MTPLAASSPKALPPVSKMALTPPIRFMGRSKSVSRVAGAPPRTSTPPAAGVSHKITVQPVPASRLVSCPTRMPGTSVISSCMCYSALRVVLLFYYGTCEGGEDMPTLHFTAYIDGSRETIFALIADLAHYDRWLPNSRVFGAVAQVSP